MQQIVILVIKPSYSQLGVIKIRVCFAAKCSREKLYESYDSTKKIIIYLAQMSPSSFFYDLTVYGSKIRVIKQKVIWYHMNKI
jgi:hypothetical protein